ncbi:MAG: hypothetical protein R3C05_28295 [Pirellulaceae bacterium]
MTRLAGAKRRIRIHPAIGIARVGNAGFVNGVPTTPASPEDYFIGPERPFETSPPVGADTNAMGMDDVKPLDSVSTRTTPAIN